MEEDKKDKMEMEAALCFVPEMLVEYLNKRNIRKLEPTSFFMHGVCLLVDISGFTKLSGQFCDQGKGGIDDLQLATNGFMDQLVDIIYAFGGDIIKFAGDAIICVFSSDNTLNAGMRPPSASSPRSYAETDEFLPSSGFHDPVADKSVPSSISAEVVLRVMHCAKLLTEVQTDKLTVHVAMSCGEMCFGILGGFENRWECLISGPCIHQLSGCLDDAPSKHAVMSRRCARIVRGAIPYQRIKPMVALSGELEAVGGRYDFSIMPLTSGNYQILSVTNGDAELSCDSTKAKLLFAWFDAKRSALVKQFVPLPIAEQLEQGSCLQFMAQIREVTTMFMRWDLYDPIAKHRDLLELQACFFQAQRILHNSGAYLRQFLVDDKGCVLIACWGMPHLSYLDNAHRAVTAAAQIRVACYQLKMDCSFGITTGDVYCGTVGSALRMEYAAIGSVVNMSARLMCEADGGILIDETTFRHLPSHEFSSFLKILPITVKGREEPLQVYSYVKSAPQCISRRLNEDMDLPHYCRHPLKSLLVKMANVVLSIESNGSVPVVKVPVASFLSVLARVFRRHRTTPVENTLAVVLIEGKAGSGRTSVVTWLKNQATECNIQTCCVRLNKKDTSVEYGMFKKLFVQLMPKDLFHNSTIQRSYVQDLLRLACPKSARSQCFVALQHLGITCTMVDGAAMRKMATREASMRTQFVWGVSESAKLNVMQESMNHIFTYLLNMQPTVVILEGLELADSASLALLLVFGDMLSHSAIICTTLVEGVDADVTDTKKSMFGPRLDYNIPLRVAHTVWARTYRVHLLALPNVSLITLENYTTEEIEAMLRETLGAELVPQNVSQLVQDISGGSYFWVREILQFIKEHGYESFMGAIGENTTDGNASAGATQNASFLNNKSRHVSGKFGSSRLPSYTDRNKGYSIHGSVRGSAYNSAHGSIRRGRNSCHSIQSTNNHRATASKPEVVVLASVTQSSNKQLDHLILVRLGALLPEEQRVLRKASVIGETFTSSTLYNLLSTHLQAHLSEFLKSLVEQNWIYHDVTSEHTYQFVHGHVRQLVYELTPLSERNQLHQHVVDYLLHIYPDEPTQYFNLWYHYQYCDADLALQYAVKVTTFMLMSVDIFEYMDCLDVLLSSTKCCKNIFGVHVLQQLRERLQIRVEALQVESIQSNSESWLMRQMPSSMRTTGCAIHGTNRNKVVPLQNQRSNQREDDTMNFRQFNSKKNISQKNTSTKGCDSNTSSAQEPEVMTSYEYLLQKIDAFRRQLRVKTLEYSTGATRSSAEEVINEATEWQIEFLRMKK